MVTRARFTADLVSTVNANTSSPANAIFISSGGDVTIANSITVGGNIPGFVQNSYVHATFAQNTSTTNLFDDRLQVANAATAYVTKAVHLTSNNALVNLINDRLQVANADTTYVTKAVALSSNTALVGLINDRLQVANLTSELSTYWPSANAIAYINANATAADMTVNTSIFVASGGETSFAIPVTSNNNLVEVVLNGYELTRSIDWTANSTHIKGIEALAAGDIVQVHEYKLHPANTLNRSAGGGGGSPSPSYSPIQGSSCGFAVGGLGGGVPYCTYFDKYPFTSDTNATSVGATLVDSGRRGAGSVSSTHGYQAGSTNPSPSDINVIQKFPFSISSGTTTDVGDLTAGRGYTSGATSSTHGYAAGGNSPTTAPRGNPVGTNRIDKFPFSSDANATDVGCLLTIHCRFGGSSSPSHGYVSGGHMPATVCAIEKFSFPSDANATSVGDLITGTGSFHSGHSSDSSGYVAGGGAWPTACNTIQKFPFSSDSNATDVADLVATRSFVSGQSSTTHGYVVGGYGTGACNTIEKFSFPSDANATDVGDLTGSCYGGAGDIAT